MAVDTQDKRFSMLGCANPGRLVMPVPDGGFGVEADRLQLAYLYRGISLAALAEGYLTVRSVTVEPRLRGIGRTKSLLDAHADIEPED